jgi:hypothetical protein
VVAVARDSLGRSSVKTGCLSTKWEGALGVYLNREIGKVSGVGYTAVSGAAKRGQGYLRSDGYLERVIKKIIAVI